MVERIAIWFSSWKRNCVVWQKCKKATILDMYGVWSAIGNKPRYWTCMKAKERNVDLHFHFIDFKSAFDTV